MKIRRTGWSEQKQAQYKTSYTYLGVSLLGSGNWNDESYESRTTSMLRK